MKTILQLIGLRSNCCNAKIISWHYDKQYCANCEQWLTKATVHQTTLKAPAPKHARIVKVRPAL